MDELTKLCERTITKMNTSDALEHIALLIDASHDTQFERGLNRTLFLLEELSKRDIESSVGALIEYFRANAWAAKSHLFGSRSSWAWEQPELQEELLTLSRAANHPGFSSLHRIRRCQILTNRANLLNSVI